MAWGNGASALVDRFDVARSVGGDPGDARTYQGFVKALLRAGLSLPQGAARRLRRRMAQIGGNPHKLFGFVAIAADGSRMELPHTAENQRVFGVAGREGSTPQLWITTLWHMGLGLPWDWRIGRAGASERHHLRLMIDDTPPDALIVADAGFTGYDLLRSIIGSGRHVLLRVGRNVELLRDLGYAQQVDEQTVYLWPAAAQKDEQPPLVLRLICLPLGPGGQAMYLLTDVPDSERLTDERAGVLYHLRWGVELCYRSLKQTLERRKLRSHGPAQALLEMHGLMLGLLLLGLMATDAIVARGGNPVSWSVAAALRVVRRAMRSPSQARDWTRELGDAVKDRYPRHRKIRRRWCRKKRHDPTPGRPRLRNATAHEVALCRRLQLQ